MSQVNIENNVVYNAQNEGISLGTYWGRGFAGSRIAGNLIFNSARDGIYFSADLGKPVAETAISGNTVYQNVGNGVTVGSNGDNIAGLTVKNNLFVVNAQQGIGGWGKSTYAIFNNDFYGNNPDYGSPSRLTPRWPPKTFRSIRDLPIPATRPGRTPSSLRGMMDLCLKSPASAGAVRAGRCWEHCRVRRHRRTPPRPPRQKG